MTKLTIRVKVFCIISLLSLFGANIYAQFTEQFSTTFPALNSGNATWGDLDNDGMLDVVINGIDGTNNKETKIYKNTGSGFTEAYIGQLVGINGYNSVCDFNADGKLDICLQGQKQDGTYTTVLYRNTGSSFVSVYSGQLVSLAGRHAWADYDNDGLMDVIISGTTSANVKQTKLYRNTGSGFQEVYAGTFPAITGFIDWGDFNNDGKTDFVIVGEGDVSIHNTLFFKNTGTGFIQSNFGEVTGINRGVARFGDYDNDGDLDLFISGRYYGTSDITEVYKNNSGNFDLVSSNFYSLTYAFGNWADIDNDGYLDMVITGYHYSSEYSSTKIYRYTGSGFAEIYASQITGKSYGSVCPGDYDNDGDLDLLLLGSEGNGNNKKVQLFRNGLGSNPSSWVANTKPGVPTSLISKVELKRAILSWQASTDNNTPSASLSYNVRIGTASGKSDIIAPSANDTVSKSNAGFRRVVSMGNGQIGNSFLVKLPQGTYYWGVQAIDNSFQGSLWSTEGSFSIANPVQASNIVTSNILYNEVKLNWTNGSASKRAVFICEGNKGMPFPVENVSYTANAVFKLGTQIEATGWYCVYKGTGNEVIVSGLTAGTIYTIAVCEFEGTAGSEIYNAETATGNPLSFTTKAGTQASDLAVTVNNREISLNWTNGGGNGRIVLVAKGDLTAPNVTNNITPTANPLHGAGSVIGTSWYCVYNGTGNSVNVSGLQLGQKYSIVVYEYDGAAGSESYMISSSSENRIVAQTTLVQSKGLTATINLNQLNLNWTNGNGSKRIVLVSKGELTAPSIANNYTPIADSIHGAGSKIGTTAWYCVYNGSGNQVKVTGLSLNQKYSVVVYDYDGAVGEETYITSSSTENYKVIQVDPLVQVSDLTSEVRVDSIKLKWTPGNADGRIVLVAKGEQSAPSLSDKSTPTANSVFGSGTQIGTSTWYCVYNGSGNEVNVTGLTGNQKYSVVAYEYAGKKGTEGYTLTISTENKIVVTTRAEFEDQTSFSFTSLMHGNAKWGDYNNDSYLDFFISGQDNLNSPVSILYKNTGSGFIVDSQFANIKGRGAWGDYNNDGLMDLLISGTDGTNANITKLYKNTGNGFSAVTDLPFSDCYTVAPSWVDYNKDGKLDLLLGLDKQVRLFKNNGSSFEEVLKDQMPKISASSVDWGDYDNDGDLDFIITGESLSSEYNTIIYKNTGDGFVAISPSNIASINRGVAKWGDYDNDGDLDVFVSGRYSGTSDKTEVWKNDNGSFTFVYSTIGLTYASGSWADINSDGKLDIVLTGYNWYDSKCYTRMYQNIDNSFVEMYSGIVPGVAYGSIDPGDYDNDGDLDLLVLGSEGDGSLKRVKIYRQYSESEFWISNITPNYPNELTSTVDNNSVLLKWTRGLDNTTPVKSLSYNLRIGTAPGKSDVVCPFSNDTINKTTEGFLRLPRIGNAQLDTVITIKALKKGVYYWSIQSVDNSFIGSKWATEQSFEITSESLAIDDLEKNNSKLSNTIVYPVPANDKLKIESKDYENSIISIFDMNGSLILKQKLSKSIEEINVNNLPRGVYYLKIRTLNGEESIKIVLQ